MVVLRYSYNTNGFAHHRLEDAIAILRDLGYDGVGITLDVHHLDPFKIRSRELEAWRKRLEGLEVVIQTGARFLLDPRRKHEPTLLSNEAEGRELRRAFLERAIEITAALGGKVVSLWSGAAPPGIADPELETRLLQGIEAVCKKAAREKVFVAFEPEPGMWIERVNQYERIRNALAHPNFGLAPDVGHLAVTGESLEEVFVNYNSEIHLVQIEDIPGRLHEHRMFGEGDLDFGAILSTFVKYNYQRLLECELSRDSHRAPVCAAKAIDFLRTAERAVR